MDPITARMLSQARISELHAEGAANRLARAQGHGRPQLPHRAEPAGHRAQMGLRSTRRSWTDRVWAFIRRSIPAHTV
jgi:hypothetical protein